MFNGSLVLSWLVKTMTITNSKLCTNELMNK